jgi:GNAT superfamily N-acetyltransferase
MIQPGIKITRALPGDAAELSAIAYSAKAYWGYPESWLRQWDETLTITPGYVLGNPTFAAASGARIAGFCSLVLRPGEAFLDHLWVLPSAMGVGIGRALFTFAEGVARSGGAQTLRVESDPHAEEFYIRMGASRYGQVAAPMEGSERFLPLLEKRL